MNIQPFEGGPEQLQVPVIDADTPQHLVEDERVLALQIVVLEHAFAHQRVTGSVGDISKPKDLDVLFADMQKQLGGLDVLVNNAGIAGATNPLRLPD